jgi:hypothetical protein
MREWAEGGESDPEALLRIRYALEHLLAAGPSWARGVEALALSYMFRLADAWPLAVFHLGEIAQRAGLLYAGRIASDAVRAALVDLMMAEASIRDARPLMALELIDISRARLAEVRLPAGVARFVHGYGTVLNGRVQEDALEVRRAAQGYGEALEGMAALVGKAAERGSVAAHCAEALAPAVTLWRREMLALDIEALVLPPVVIWALLGRARCATGLGADELDRLWHDSRRLISDFGFPPGMTSRLVADSAAGLLPVAGRESVLSFFGVPTPQALQRTGIDPADLEPQVLAAVAHATVREDSVAAQHLYRVALERAARQGHPDTTAFTFGRYVGDFVRGLDARRPELEALVRSLSFLSQHVTVADKAALDPAVAVLLDYALALWRAAPSQFGRRRVGVLLELFARPAPAIMPLLADLERGNQAPMPLWALWTASDWLGRIARALRHHPGTAVLIMRSTTQRTTFLGLTPNGSQPIHVEARREDLTAAEGLGAAAANELEFGLFAGSIEDSTSFIEQCRAGHDALPEPVRGMLHRYRTLLVVEDVHNDARGIPLELLHDGVGYLGTTRVVAWLPSLRDTAFALEGNSAIAWERRAVVAAAPNVVGGPSLLHAAAEADNVRLALSDRGWHAPPVREERLTSHFVVDRLAHIAVLHLAGHGEVTGDEEALLLPGGHRLTSDDLGTARRPGMPFVYLNACHLGATRYVGGGLRKGLAHRLLELGAPAVIASRTPVDDRVAAAVGTRFYAEARSCPVGEALRRARAALAGAGVGAAGWSTTVLLGNPHVVLPVDSDARPVAPDLATRLLDTSADPAKDEAAVTKLVRRARRQLRKDPDDPKLDAAVQLTEALSPLDEREPRRLEGELRFALEAAEQLGNAGLTGAVRLRLAVVLHDAGRDGDALAVLAPALPVFDGLALARPGWGKSRLGAYALWKLLDAGQRGEGVLVPPDTADDSNSLKAAVGTAAIAEGARRLPLRLPEAGLDDLLWNAVVVGHPRRFDRARARMEVAASLADKLRIAGEIPGSTPWAVTVLAGLLSYLWEAVTALDDEAATAAAGVLRVAVGDLRDYWNPPASEWFTVLQSFCSAVAISIEDVRAGKGAEGGLERVHRSWVETALTLRREHHYALASGSAFALGFITQLASELPNADGPVAAYVRDAYEVVAAMVKAYGALRQYRLGFPTPNELTAWRMKVGWEEPSAQLLAWF